jgi:colicin import membrane protein
MKLNLREPGLPASVVLHGAILLAGVISFSNPKPFADAAEAIAVEVIDESAAREIMKGDPGAKPQPTPTPRVDRVDDKKEQNAPGEAKRQVNVEQTPKPQEATAKDERKETTAAVTPPPPAPRIVPPAPPKAADPPKIADPPKPVEPPKPAAAKPPVPSPAKEEEEEEAEEVIRQAARKKAEEQKKLEDQRRAEDARKRDEQRRQDEARRQQEQQKQEQLKQEQARAEQQRQEQQRREQEQARQRDEQKKIADAKAAETRAADERRKAEEAKKTQEAARKAAEDRQKREAEQAARNQATADAARRALLASREAPQNSGNTGQQVSRTPSQGAPTATGQRMNPSEKGQLLGMLADQIRACWNIPVSGKPSVLPQVRMVLNPDGSLAGQPVLINASGDPTFRAVADSGMRAIRQCSPFRIPARFAPTHGDWRSIIVQLNPDD